MSKKMIECLECHGRGWFVTSIGSINECAKCGTAGRIPDRRKPSEIEDALRAEVAKYRGMEVEDAALRNDNEALRAEVEVRGDQVSALMEQVAHYMAEAQELRAELHQVRMNWDAALKAELAKRDEPLTDEQAEQAFAIAKADGVGECDTLALGMQGIDAAIRRVRKGE